MPYADLLTSKSARTRLDVARARKQFLSDPETDLSSIRPLIARSWFRSRAAGVDAVVDRNIRGEGRVDERTMEAAEPHLRELDEIAADLGGYVRVAAPSGVLVRPGFLRAVSDYPAGYSLLEEHCGTNGDGLALEEGHSVWIAPEEHFRDDMQGDWCFASLVRDPFHSRVRAVIGLTLPGRRHQEVDPSSTLLMLEGIAARIVRKIEDRTSARERTLLNEYLTISRRYGSSAVIALDGKNVLMNTAAASSLDKGDFSVVSSYAKEVTSSARVAESDVTLRGPGPVRLDVSPVQLAPCEVGAIVVMRPHTELRKQRFVGRQTAVRVGDSVDPIQDGLAASLDGVSAEFQRTMRLACQAIEQCRSASIIGEVGTGKERLARAIAGISGHFVVLERADRVAGSTRLAGIARRAVASGQRILLLKDADSLPLSLAVELAGIVQQNRACQLVMTVTRPTEATLRISEALGVLEIATAPLRNRREDVSLLAQTCAREMGDRKLSPTLLSALTDADWPRNIDQLFAVVRNAVSHAQGAEVTVEDLPRGFHRAMTDGRLSRLEDAELSELRSALQEAEGNRRVAAELLQIGRTTLYRRMNYFRGKGFDF